MDKDAADKLDSLFVRYQQKQSTAKVAADQKLSAEEQFKQQFLAAAASTWKPLFEEYAERLRQQGFHARVTLASNPKDRLELQLDFGKQERLDPQERPALTLWPDLHDKVVLIHNKNMGLGHGGTAGVDGKFSIADLTPNVLSDHLVKWLEKSLFGAW